MSKVTEMQRIYHYYKDSTGQEQVEMREVVRWAVANGMPLPKPIDPIDRLAKEFSQALRQEIRYDEATKKPYRANHAVTEMRNGQQLTFWIDIDEARRHVMHKSLVQRREQMVGDAYQLSLDQEHWNRANPTEEPILLPLDFTLDVEIKKHMPGDDELDEAS